MKLTRFPLLASLLALSCLVLGGCIPPSSGGGKKEPAPAAKQQPCIVLALPGSGPYAPVANKIRRGATTAVQEMKANGIDARLEQVNTSAADWLAKLDALPESCAVVGGPLQAPVYAGAKQAGALQKRAFFTFMPALDDGEEGTQAWRFFPSPQDQIDALLAFATDSMGISTFGAFHPGDAYGLRMTGLMEQTLAKRGLSLQKASYDARNPNAWVAAAAQLINPTQAQDGSNATPIPQTAFEALFLPDSWRNMPMLTTALVYNGEDRLVLMGTTLWEQVLSGKSVPSLERYALAVFPGAWNQTRAPKALQGAGHDFWTALGYDFARFCIQLGLVKRPPAPDLNAAIARLRMVWGMAPIKWDGNGIAHQQLYLFQPAANGMKPLNLDEFKAARQAILQRAALRMQGLPSVDEQGNPLVPGTQPGQPVLVDGTGQPLAQPAVAQPGMQPTPQQPAQQPLGTTPLPSYKLRLPGSAR